MTPAPMTEEEAARILTARVCDGPERINQALRIGAAAVRYMIAARTPDSVPASQERGWADIAKRQIDYAAALRGDPQ